MTLYNVELNDLYPSPNTVRVIKSRRMRWAGHVARIGERIGVYRVLVGKSEGKRPLGRTRPRWEDNIKIHIQEVGWGPGLGHVVGFCSCGNEHSGSIKCGQFLD